MFIEISHGTMYKHDAVFSFFPLLFTYFFQHSYMTYLKQMPCFYKG